MDFPLVLAAADVVADLGWLGQALGGMSFFAFLGLLWRVSGWHKGTEDRLEGLEKTINGDGKANEGCALRHKQIDKVLGAVPSRDSVSDAFNAVRALEAKAAEDRQKFAEVQAQERQKFAVAMERIEGVLERLEGKIDSLAEEERERRVPVGR